MKSRFFIGGAAALSLLGACATTTPVEKVDNGMLEPEKGPDGAIIRRYDIDGDGKANLWRTFITEPGDAPGTTRERAVRVDLDLNFDGRVDTRRFLDAAGDVEKEEMDLDYDGKVDAIATFDHGAKIREDVFLSHSTNPDVVRLYGDGKLIEKRRDVDDNGTFDVFEFYDNGRLVRIGKDTNGDGQPDKYDERPDADDLPPEEKGDSGPASSSDSGDDSDS